MPHPNTHHEVDVRHEIQADGYVVEAVRWECIVRLQHAVKVVRVPASGGCVSCSVGGERMVQRLRMRCHPTGRERMGLPTLLTLQ